MLIPLPAPLAQHSCHSIKDIFFFNTKDNTLLFRLGFYEAFKETDHLFSSEVPVQVGILGSPFRHPAWKHNRIHLLIHPWVFLSLSDFLCHHGEIAIHHVTITRKPWSCVVSGDADSLVLVDYAFSNCKLLQRFILNFKRPSRPRQLN